MTKKTLSRCLTTIGMLAFAISMALPEPVLQGRKVNMDDAMWEDAINELDEYIDQQIGGN